jgi:hypothetical protein
LSILLKALKKHGSDRDAQKVFALLDQGAIDVCKEEVLMSTLLGLHTARRDPPLAGLAHHFRSRTHEAVLAPVQGVDQGRELPETHEEVQGVVA